MQIKELEDTLAKETDRAQDLKVKIASKIASTSGYKRLLNESDLTVDQTCPVLR